ncbi:hypothetical protein F2981_32530 (plasmid) [Sinorhizobium meliloti]|nr:hypothetical protein [Sinorhizobium meliloti]
MEQETLGRRSEVTDPAYKQTFLALEVLSDSERSALIGLMRRGSLYFSDCSGDIQGLFRKNIVFPIDDDQQVFTVRGDIWAAREQVLNTHDNEQTLGLFSHSS